MPIRIVQLGSPRQRGEGVRLGTVRRPPRGVPKNRYAKDNYYDVWLPNLAPTQELLASAHKWNIVTDVNGWKRFEARYRSEMSRPENSRVLDALAALSHNSSFSVGCYCDDERRCHRGILRRLLEERGAKIIP
jgi:uncharacterized protein YeaO (DUF488 family)